MAGLRSFTRTLSNRNPHGSYDRMIFNVWENTKTSTTQVTAITKDASGTENRSKGKINAFQTWDEALDSVNVAITAAEALGWRHIGKATPKHGFHRGTPASAGIGMNPPTTQAPPQPTVAQATHTQAQQAYVNSQYAQQARRRPRPFAPPRPVTPPPPMPGMGGQHPNYFNPYATPVAPVAPPPPSDFTTMDEAARAIIKAGHIALAKKYHPDVGGQPGTMAALNQAKDQLNEVLDLIKK